MFYIHANPQKQGFVSDFRFYEHSSYRNILSSKPTKLMREELLSYFGGLDNFIEYHEQKGDQLIRLEHDLEGED